MANKKDLNLKYLNMAIKSKLIQIRKIVGVEKGKDSVITRQYIEIIVDPKVENNIYKIMQKKYIIALRNYEKKFIFDNLSSLKYVPLAPNLEFPNGLKVDPFSIKVCKKSGEYGIALSVKCLSNNRFTLENKESFYDTTEARDLVNADKFPGKSSILIFCISMRQTVNDILTDLEAVFTPPKKAK